MSEVLTEVRGSAGLFTRGAKQAKATNVGIALARGGATVVWSCEL